MSVSEYPPPELRYPPEPLDPADTAQLEKWFDELDRRPIESEQQLRSWLGDCLDFYSRCSAESSRRNIAYVRNTADGENRRRHEDFVARVRPFFEKRWNVIETRLIGSPFLSALEAPDYEVYLRETREDLELFRKENTELGAEDRRLFAEYAQLTGALTIQHHGETLTLPQTMPLLESTDRAEREEVWRKVAEARAGIRDRVGEIFAIMLDLRKRIAENAEFSDYRAYRFRELHRFDYGAAECVTFHDAVAEHFVPLASRILEERRRKLDLDSLRPWDLAVDPDGSEPFAPYDNEEQLVDLATHLFELVDTGFAADFRFLVHNDCLDLWTRQAKAPGGFQALLADTRLPFIFANSAGSPRDLRTVLHEGGHSFHSLLARHFDILPNCNAPIEFAEVASTSMELMCSEHYDSVFPPKEAKRTRRQQIEHVVMLFPWVATIDSFQHWLYTHHGHGSDERTEAWRSARTRFAPEVDWSGLEDHRDYEWQRQLHLFKVPFYYIEYAIAQIGALQIWTRYRKDPSAAVQGYRDGLALGGSRPLPELFAAAGIRFGFGSSILSELAGVLEEELFR